MTYDVRELFLRSLWQKQVYVYVAIGNDMIAFTGELTDYDEHNLIIKQENGDKHLIIMHNVLMIGEAETPWYEQLKETNEEAKADDDMESGV